MPLTIQCPRCSRELTAPDELVGQLAACPDCSTQFPIVPNGNPAEPPAPSTADDSPTASDSRWADPPPSAQTEPPSQLEHVSMSAGMPSAMEPPSAKPTPKTQSSPATSADTAANSPVQSPTKSPTSRKPKQAKFISGDAQSTSFQLGADGELPRLKLEEKKKEKTDDEGGSSSPLVLLLAVGVSLMLTAVMLFVPSETTTSESGGKAAARDMLRLYYIGKEAPFEAYQLTLREALQAHSRGDAKTERRRYRKVLDMLKAEGHDKYKGLTGRSNAQSPPHDRHLAEQLTVLLAES
jgi:hypothetical protein